MNIKTTLPLVCRAWYGPSIEYLYGNITLRTVGYTAPEKGAVIRVAPQMERVHLFHAETGERLNA